MVLQNANNYGTKTVNDKPNEEKTKKCINKKITTF